MSSALVLSQEDTGWHLGVVGRERGPWTRSWTSDDALMFIALGVGGGPGRPERRTGLSPRRTNSRCATWGNADVSDLLAQFGGPELGLDRGGLPPRVHAAEPVRSRCHRPDAPLTVGGWSEQHDHRGGRGGGFGGGGGHLRQKSGVMVVTRTTRQSDGSRC